MRLKLLHKVAVSCGLAICLLAGYALKDKFESHSASHGYLVSEASGVREWHGAGISSESAPLRHALPAGTDTVRREIYVPVFEKLARKYPRGLLSHALEAIDKVDGTSALELSSLVDACQTVVRDVESMRVVLAATADATVRELLDAQYKGKVRMQSDCQSLGAEQQTLRTRLLEVALSTNVVGAAAELFGDGSRDPRTLGLLRRDALAGDARSITQLAGHGDSVFLEYSNDVAVARAALQEAVGSASPELAEQAGTALLIAKKISWQHDIVKSRADRTGDDEYPGLNPTPRDYNWKIGAMTAVQSAEVKAVVARWLEKAKKP